MPYDNIEVVIHPESIVHSLVQYKDGSLLAHLGPHDMRIPIQYALTYPQRQKNNLEHIDLAALGALHFAKPDLKRFPCLRLAIEAGKVGGGYPAVLNGANEVLVAAFLAGQIAFNQIGDNMAEIMEAYAASGLDSGAKTIEEVLAADKWGRRQAHCLCRQMQFIK
jgi:1-deoxy-D-xylulose-5-phosphate reductoisomerase